MVILFTENGYNSFLSLAKLIKSNIKSHHMGIICIYVLRFLN